MGSSSSGVGYKLVLIFLFLHGCCCYYRVGVDAVDAPPPEVDRVCKRADRDYYDGIYDFCVHVLLIDKRASTANLTTLGFIGFDSEFYNVSLTYEFIKMVRQNATGDKACYDICLQLYDTIFEAINYGKKALSEKDYRKMYYMASAIIPCTEECSDCFERYEKSNPFKERNFHVRSISMIILGVANLLLGWS